MNKLHTEHTIQQNCYSLFLRETASTATAQPLLLQVVLLLLWCGSSPRHCMLLPFA
jgi:hypothetical protein